MAVPVVIANPKKKKTPPKDPKTGQFLKRTRTRGTHPRAQQAASKPSKPQRRKASHARGQHPHGATTTAIVKSSSKAVRRRTANPLRIGSVAGWLTIAAAATGGILVAKVLSNLWKQYVSPMVRGSGLADWRAWLDDVLRLVAMEAGVWGLSKVLTRYLKMEKAGQIVLYAGTGETVRQAIGALVRNLSPGTDRASIGLDGPGGGLVSKDPDGVVYLQKPDGTEAPIGVLAGPDGEEEFYTIDELRDQLEEEVAA